MNVHHLPEIDMYFFFIYFVFSLQIIHMNISVNMLYGSICYVLINLYQNVQKRACNSHSLISSTI